MPCSAKCQVKLNIFLQIATPALQFATSCGACGLQKLFLCDAGQGIPGSTISFAKTGSGAGIKIVTKNGHEQSFANSTIVPLKNIMQSFTYCMGLAL